MNRATALRRSAISLALFPAAVFSVHTTAAAAEGDQVSLNVLGITDFHGHISESLSEEGVAEEMGAGALACYVDKERDANPATSFVSAGDNIGGSPFLSSILQDKPTLDALNAMGLEASAVGNHELDKGWEDLRDRVSVNGSKQAKFPYLGANVEGSTMAPSTVVERDGVKIGYVGVITDTTPTLVSPAGIQGLSFNEPVASAKKEADRLKESGEADVVVVLAHEGVDSAGFGDNADAVIAGHTHATRGAEGEPLVIQPGSYGQLLSDIDIVYDKAADEVVSVKARNITADTVWKECGATPNAKVQAIVDAAEDAAAEEGSKTVTTLANSFFRGADSNAEPGSNRGTESSLNSLLADAALYGINENTDLGADVGVMNAGGVRADLNSGELTYSEAYQVQPFNNSMGVVDITGAELKGLVEEQWKLEGDRAVLQLGFSENVQYSYDPEAPHGQRVTHMTVDGKPVDENATYRVAGSAFLLNEGDGFTSFGTVSGDNKIIDAGVMDIDAFNQYLSAHRDLDIRKNQTSVGIHIDGAREDGSLPEGEEITVNVSSLSYTGGEGQPKTATVELVGGNTTAKAEATVDNAITDGRNETGQAQVRLKVPAGATELKITDDFGTTFTYPVSTEGTGENPEDPNKPGEIPGFDGSSGSSMGSLSSSGIGSF